MNNISVAYHYLLLDNLTCVRKKFVNNREKAVFVIK